MTTVTITISHGINELSTTSGHSSMFLETTFQGTSTLALWVNLFIPMSGGVERGRECEVAGRVGRRECGPERKML